MENLDACAVLSARESQDVLEHVILPAATEGVVPQDHPVVVIVGGQPGAGKTEIADRIQAALDRRGGAVRVCRDLYKAVHRHYTAALAADIRTATRPPCAHAGTTSSKPAETADGRGSREASSIGPGTPSGVPPVGPGRVPVPLGPLSIGTATAGAGDVPAGQGVRSRTRT